MNLINMNLTCRTLRLVSSMGIENVGLSLGNTMTDHILKTEVITEDRSCSTAGMMKNAGYHYILIIYYFNYKLPRHKMTDPGKFELCDGLPS